jgi:hypothetical protein
MQRCSGSADFPKSEGKKERKILATSGFVLHKCIEASDTDLFFGNERFRIFNANTLTKHSGTGYDTYVIIGT